MSTSLSVAPARRPSCLGPTSGQRLAPHDALGVARCAAERVRRVVGEEQLRDDARRADREVGGVADTPRRAEPEQLPDALSREPEPVGHGACREPQRSCGLLSRGTVVGRHRPGLAAIVLEMLDRLECLDGSLDRRDDLRAIHRAGEVGAGVGGGGLRQGQQHPRQRDAVRERVVDAQEHRRALPVAVDEVELPERVGVVERLGEVALDVVLERAVVTRRRQGEPPQVPVEGEVLVVHPPGLAEDTGDTGGVRSLVEDRERLDDPAADQLGDLVPVGHSLEEHQRLDDHEVVGSVHVEPDGVDGADASSDGWWHGHSGSRGLRPASAVRRRHG